MSRSNSVSASRQALETIRGCCGLNLVGGDLVEVAPPYDLPGKSSGRGSHCPANTALLAANLLFEMICVLPGVKTY
ncbi:guanidino acid hydrolase, mitochondrial [Gastrophryne carolinensis]